MKLKIYLFSLLFLSNISLALESPTLGKDGAPLDVVIAVDMECPYSRNALNETVPKLVERYGNLIHFTVKQMPLEFHRNAPLWARGALCANEQKLFWDYVKNPSINEFKKENKKLDALTFDRCTSSPGTKLFVEKEKEWAERKEASGTPTFWMNEKKFIGNQREALTEFLDAEVKRLKLPNNVLTTVHP